MWQARLRFVLGKKASIYLDSGNEIQLMKIEML